MELDPLSYALVLEEIAKACANTAMTVHMHTMVTRLIAAIGSTEQKERYFRAVVEGGEMFGSWGSEPGVSIASGGFRTTLERSGEGYVLNGSKYFCTIGGAAAYAMVWCTWKGDDDSPPGMTWAVVPTGHPGVEIHGDWDPLGLRGTVSPAADFRDCRVEADWGAGQAGRHGGLRDGRTGAVHAGMGGHLPRYRRWGLRVSLRLREAGGPRWGAGAGARRRHATGRRRDGLGAGRAASDGAPGGVLLGRGRPRGPAAMDVRGEAGVRRCVPSGGVEVHGVGRRARRAQGHCRSNGPTATFAPPRSCRRSPTRSW